VTRPTRDQLAHAQGLLEELACNPDLDDAFHHFAAMMDMLVWVNSEQWVARRQSVWTPGADVHTIGRHGLNRPVESRLDFGSETGRNQRGGPEPQPPIEPADQAYKAFTNLRKDWGQQLASWRWQWRNDAESKGGWPDRSEEAG
jgi:hypothetical protein